MPKIVRIGLIVVAVIAGFLIAASIIAPRVFKIDSYRGDVVAMLDQQTGWQIAIGHLGLRIFPTIAFRADHVAISNPPGFPAGDWFTAQRIYARLELGPLLHGQVVIGSLDVDNPALALLENARRQWNFQLPSAAGAASAHPGASDPSLFTLQKISKVVIKQGTLSAASLGPQENSTRVICDDFSATLEDIILPPARQNQGRPGPQTPALPSASGNLAVSSISAGPLRVTKISSPVQTSPAGVLLKKLEFELYGGKGNGAVQISMAGAAPQYQAHIHLSGVSIEKLLDAFPAWRGQMTGEMASEISLRGQAQQGSDPWSGTQGHGTLTIRKGKLPKLQLNGSLTDLMHLAHIGPANGDFSSFSSIVASWQLANGVLSNSSIRIVGSGINVEASGYAQMAGAGELHYHGTAEIEAHRNALTSILADLSGAGFKNGKIDFPFNLEGTFEKPVFRMNPAKTTSTPAPAPRQAQPADAIRDIFNLFRSKKSPGR